MRRLFGMAIAVSPTADEPVTALALDGRPLTWHDLQERQLPDGLRFELVDGVLLVSPAPIILHQRVVSNVVRLLCDAVPPDLDVLTAPVDWYVSETTVFQPDVLVARIDDPRAGRLDTTPVLAVEVLSPSTRLRDLGLKRRAYEDIGLPRYWVVDPDRPQLTVLRLDGSRFVEEAVVAADDEYAAGAPVSVKVVPRALIELPGGWV
jgi:Uma2 family endonuclease